MTRSWAASNPCGDFPLQCVIERARAEMIVNGREPTIQGDEPVDRPATRG